MLNIAAIEKSYGPLNVLRRVDLDVPEGEFLVLLGPSGCGKSTLLNIIAGLDAPSGGAIEIGGADVTGLEPKDRNIAMVFQSYALYPSMTVAENLKFGMRVRGVPAAEQEKSVDEVSRILKLDQLLSRKPSQLSGGQRQRVAMGRALVRQPKVFLFDEPLSNLDAQLRVEMRTELKKLHTRLGATIVYVTHDQVEAMTLATRVVVMNGGVVQQVGAPQEVYDRPSNVFVARFIGSPAMNLLPGTVVNGDTGPRFVFAGSDVTLALPDADMSQLAGRDLLMGVRPESIELSETAQGPNVLPIDIELTEPMGSDTLAIFTLGGAETMARLAPGACVPGDRLSLRFPPEKLLVYDAAEGTLLS